MKVICICSELKSYLNNCEKELATVHSVYKNSVNIMSNNGMFITLLSDSSDIQPMSLIMEDTCCTRISINPGDDVILSSDGISINRCNIWLDINSSNVWNPNIRIKESFKSKSEIATGFKALQDILLNQPDDLGLYPLVHRLLFDTVIRVDDPYNPKLNHYCDFIQERLVNLLGYIGGKNFGEAENIIPRFIGFGTGLTPSSDDLLCGMFAVIAYASYEDEHNFQKLYSSLWENAKQFAENAYKLSVGKTTVVSEQMLMHAKDGKFPESYHIMMQSLMLDNQIDVSLAAKEVMKRGAASGRDFLFGVYCMESIILNLW